MLKQFLQSFTSQCFWKMEVMYSLLFFFLLLKTKISERSIYQEGLFISSARYGCEFMGSTRWVRHARFKLCYFCCCNLTLKVSIVFDLWQQYINISHIKRGFRYLIENSDYFISNKWLFPFFLPEIKCKF